MKPLSEKLEDRKGTHSYRLIKEAVERTKKRLKRHFNCGSWTTEEIQFEINKIWKEEFGEFK